MLLVDSLEKNETLAAVARIVPRRPPLPRPAPAARGRQLL